MDYTEGYVAHRWLEDGRLLGVSAMTFGKFRLNVTGTWPASIEDSW